MTAKEQIIDIFRKNVKGKTPDVTGINERHCGKYGHWLERQFGIQANGDNAPDLMGYELKNETTQKTTFGDWSANIYVFTSPEHSKYFAGTTKWEKQNSFVQIFGKPNMQKNGRCSWSGSPCPKINEYNDFGQILIVTAKNDIIAEYSFSKDKRPNKNTIVPEALQIEHLPIAIWFGESVPTGFRGKCLSSKFEDKFDDLGWFTCKTDYTGKYDRICFGKPLTYIEWINLVKQGIVYFDSGMYYGNKRPYSMWRANNQLWESLIIETYR